MPTQKILQATIGVAVLAALSPASHASLLLYYNFDSDSLLSNGIRNVAPGATVNGTLIEGTNAAALSSFVTSGAPGASGKALSFTEAPGSNATVSDYIDTNFVTSSLGITSGTAYTAMAWVKFGNQNADNMIFGAAVTGASLHLGSRGANYHSGHWADDYTIGTTDVNAWHHVAYTNGLDGTQEIFVDGLSIGSGATGTTSGMDTSLRLAIGTGAPGDAALSGIIDEVKIFNTRLTSAEIQTAATVVPEPSTLTALFCGVALLGGVRRRRK
ncbi:MAG: hypothetical protein JWL59_1448 [Chthoniobacteraceae bacterium]|nr:hypothetical protein [Chthoniobacteraceae bacterium]